MIDARSTFCKKHWKKTPEHQAKITEALKGKKLSEATKQKLSEAKRKRAIKLGNNSFLKECLWCGTEFIVKPSMDKNGDGKYCCSDCVYEARSGSNSRFWSGGKIELSCPQCRKHFLRDPASMTSNLIFCSSSCRSIYYIAFQKKSGTDIEKAMKKALERNDYEFLEQRGISNISVVDFYLPKQNLIIFCDGDYWHRLPGQELRDIKQTEALQALGYKVLRFWGKDILNDIEGCLNTIRQELSLPTTEPRIKQLELF